MDTAAEVQRRGTTTQLAVNALIPTLELSMRNFTGEIPYSGLFLVESSY